MYTFCLLAKINKFEFTHTAKGPTMTQLSKNIGLQTSSPGDSSNRQTHKSKSQNAQPINEHVMTLITFLALLPMVYFIPDVVGQFLPAIKWLNVTVAVGIMVPIMSYVVMPAARHGVASVIRYKRVA